MAIEKPSETATHTDATVGYWLSETDARKAIYEQGRQAGLREALHRIETMHYWYIGGVNCQDRQREVFVEAIRALLPTDAQNTSE